MTEIETARHEAAAAQQLADEARTADTARLDAMHKQLLGYTPGPDEYDTTEDLRRWVIYHAEAQAEEHTEHAVELAAARAAQDDFERRINAEIIRENR
jgi:hypothetical protein